MTVIFDPQWMWDCQFCNLEHRTQTGQPVVPMHPCPAKGGMTVPMRQTGSDTRIRIGEREDYVGGQIVTWADRTPVAAVYTDHGDGRIGCHAYAGSAVVTGSIG